MGQDFFEHKADGYEQVRARVENVENIANSILSKVNFDPAMHLMDFGSGTGLLLERVAAHVKKITAIDVSASMNRQLENKRESIDCELEILEMDLSKRDLNQKFDGIVSSMTMHHIEDTESMLAKFHSLLKDGGVLAIADLDLENGSFHTEDTGVFHFGFDRETLLRRAQEAGFKNVTITSASTVRKSQGDYGVFLLIGYR